MALGHIGGEETQKQTLSGPMPGNESRCSFIK